MAKKNFEEINTGNILVFVERTESAASETIQAPIPRQKQGKLPTEEIVQMAREQGKTQGRAGCKAHRFNMAFSPKAYDFIVCMARVRGETITGFVNHLIEKCIDENQEVYQKALGFRDSL